MPPSQNLAEAPLVRRFALGQRVQGSNECRTSGAVVNMKPHVVSLSANWYAASPNITCLPVVAPLVLHETRWLSSLDRFSPRTIVATPSVSCTTATPVSRHRERYSSRRSRKNRAAARRNVADLTMPRHSACHVSGRPRPERPDRTDGPAPQGATGRTDRRKRGSGQTPGAKASSRQPRHHNASLLPRRRAQVCPKAQRALHAAAS